MAFEFSNPVLTEGSKRNRYEVTNAETFEFEGYKIIILDEGEIASDENGNKLTGHPINIDTMNEFSQYIENELKKSRKCNNEFDDVVIARRNLGLNTVATSGDYNDLINTPDFYAALAGFSSLKRCSSSTNNKEISLNYKKKYCFMGYGGYTGGMLLNVTGGSWAGRELSSATNFIVVPTYSGTMMGSQNNFYFLTTKGKYNFQAAGPEIKVTISRPDCYAFGEETLYSY